VLLLYHIGLMFEPFLFSALWAGLLAHWAFPLHLRLTALWRGNRYHHPVRPAGHATVLV
jgi:hypothetical protein